MQKLLVVISTHSEAIRAAPLVHCLQAVSSMQTIVCVVSRNCQLLARELAIFAIEVDEELELVEKGATKSNPPHAIDSVIDKHKPDCVLVFGSSASLTGSLSRHVNFSNFGAGLRMYELQYRSSEGADTNAVDLVATRYFVHTETARDELLKQGIAPENVFVADSTEVDAVKMVADRIRNDRELEAKLATDLAFLDPGKRLILVSGHRLENHEACFENLFHSLKSLAMRPDVQVAYPVHPDSMVNGIGCETFVYHPNITLIPPQDYLHYVYLMQNAFLILTDSGDTLKEVSSLNKPVLEMGEASGCWETVNAQTAGTAEKDAGDILRECTQLLDDPFYYKSYSSRRNPYGDGHASQRIVETLLR